MLSIKYNKINEVKAQEVIRIFGSRGLKVLFLDSITKYRAIKEPHWYQALQRRFLIFLLVLVSYALTGCAGKEIANIDSRGTNIICFGDSLTSGEGAAKGNDYPSLLARAVSVPVINAGAGGDTTQTALSRLDKEVLMKDPLMVIVILGGNDFLHKLPKRETFRNLEDIVKRIQARGTIVVLGEVRSGWIMSSYAGGYRRIARRAKAVLIPDLLRGILNKPELMSDHIHPNDKGYRILAEKIIKVVQPLLRQNLSTRDDSR